MPIHLSEVPPPEYSDGTTEYYPTVYTSPRQPPGGYKECDPSRVRKYLDKLSGSLKDAYLMNPSKIPGLTTDEIMGNGGVIFKPNATLKVFPANYRMFESKPPDNYRKPGEGGTAHAGDNGDATPNPGTPGSASRDSEDRSAPISSPGAEPPDSAEPKSETAAPDSVTAGSEDQKPKTKERGFRADAFIFGHPSGSKYRSTNEFIPHLIWLVTDDTHDHHNCPCKLCVNFLKSYGKSYPKGKAKLGEKVMAATPVPAPKTRSLVKNETPDQSPLAVSAPTTSRSTPFPPHEEHHPPRRRKPVAIPARTMLPSEDIMMRPSPRTEVDKLKASAHETPTRASDMEQSDAEPSTPGKQKSSRSKDADIRYRKKYSELKRKIAEFEEANAVLAKEYSIARQKISRLRFERSLILERLEEVEIHRPRPAVSDSESGLEHLRPAKKKHRTRTRQPIPPPIPPPPITPATQPRKRAPKKPKEKKPFDPKAPKRPANAFMLFCEMTRQQLKTEREGLDEASIEEKGLGNITKALGMRWQQLTEEGKNVWRNEFQKQVQRYDREMRAYEAANISSPIRVPSPPPFPSEPSMRSDNGHDIPLTSPTAADVHSDVVSHRSDDPNIMNAHSIPGPTSMEGIVGYGGNDA